MWCWSTPSRAIRRCGCSPGWSTRSSRRAFASPPTTCAATARASGRRPATPPPSWPRTSAHCTRQLGLEPAHLVGHSFGGVVGMHAAHLFPECVAGVVLSDSFFPGLRHVEPNFGRTNVWVDLRETFEKVGVELGETVDFTRLFRSCRGSLRRASEDARSTGWPVGRGWLRQLPRLAETTCGDEVLAEAGLTADAIRGIERPVVALYDEFSPFLATCRWLETNLSDCEVEIIPAAKHLAVVENTAAFTDAVLRHLKRMAGVAAE